MRMEQRGPGYYLIDATDRTIAAMTADKGDAKFILDTCNAPMTSIHYRLRCGATDPQQVRELISQLHQHAHELAFNSVEDLIELEGDASDYRHDEQSPHNWLLIQSRHHVTDPLEPARHFGVIP